jgi:hypothetical protein
MKESVKINESQLRDIISNSIKKVQERKDVRYAAWRIIYDGTYKLAKNFHMSDEEAWEWLKWAMDTWYPAERG